MQDRFVLYLMDKCEDSLSWAVFFFSLLLQRRTGAQGASCEERG